MIIQGTISFIKHTKKLTVYLNNIDIIIMPRMSGIHIEQHHGHL